MAERLYRAAAAAGGGFEELTRSEVWARIRRGTIDATTEICVVGTPYWVRAGAFPELQKLLGQEGRSATTR